VEELPASGMEGGKLAHHGDCNMGLLSPKNGIREFNRLATLEAHTRTHTYTRTHTDGHGELERVCSECLQGLWHGLLGIWGYGDIGWVFW
jgi:hypothetical protein